MCSLSIVERGAQRFITMNRDEARSRHEYPSLFSADATHPMVYPRDAQAGGTWFGVNGAGIVLALLNRYQDPQVQGKHSRGWLIPELLKLPTVAAMRAQFDGVEPALFVSDYNPFDLVFIDAKHVLRLSWNGAQATWHEHSAPCFFTSSSLRPLEVIALRETTFDDWQSKSAGTDLDAESILHTLHWADKADAQTAIRMRREQTHSKSLCQVTLASQTLRLSYWNEDALSKFALPALMHAGEHVSVSLFERS